MIWDDSSDDCSTLDMPIHDPTTLTWGKFKSHLAIGSASGNALLYKEFAETPISIVGALPSFISYCAWDCSDSFLAVASVASKQVALLNEEGEISLQFTLKLPPVSIAFPPLSQSTGSSINAVCINSGGKILYLSLIDANHASLVHSFNYTRGEIVKCIWINSGQIFIGFQSGELTLLSVHLSDRPSVNEVWSKSYNDAAPLLDLQFISCQRRIFAVGTENVFFLEYSDETFIPVIDDMFLTGDTVYAVSLSPEGSLLCLAKTNGNLQFFSISSRAPFASNGHHIAFMSPSEKLFFADTTSQNDKSTLALPFKPRMLAIGDRHVAVSNQFTVLVVSKMTKETIFMKSFLQPILELNINSKNVAFLSHSLLHIYELPSSPNTNIDGRIITFEHGDVTCLSMTEQFIIAGTSRGSIEFVLIADRKLSDGLRYVHSCSIKLILPSPNGTRLFVVDDSGEAYIYLPWAQKCLKVPGFPRTFDRIIWDITDKNVVNVIDGPYVHCYVYIHRSIRGTLISKLGRVQIEEGGTISIQPMPFQMKLAGKPIICNGGEFVLLDSEQLRFAKSPFYSVNETSDGAFAAFITLLKFEAAWNEALILNERRLWLALANKSLEVLDIEVALLVYKLLNDAGMVMIIEALQPIENVSLLTGHILVTFMEYDTAEGIFLECSREDLAIEMRMNMLQFDEALSLASKSRSINCIFGVSLKYGQHLESIGEYTRALGMYEMACNLVDAKKANVLTDDCAGGIARTSIFLGDFERGIRIAKQIKSKGLQISCAELLVSLNQPMEGAALFEHCQEFDLAAKIYLEINHISFLKKNMNKISSPRLLTEIGAAFEDKGNFLSSMEAYELAGKIDCSIRVSLEKCGDFGAAVEKAKSNNSIEGAKRIIGYCLKQGISDYQTIVELFLMTGQQAEAFSMAKQHNIVDFFVGLQDITDPDLVTKVAQYFEGEKQLGKAGYFYKQAGQYYRAVSLYLEAGENYYNAAIEIAVSTKDQSHIQSVIDYLSKERDGQAKDPIYICKLYLSLEMYNEAKEAVLFIAQRDQKIGEYQKVYDLVSRFIIAMERRNVFVPNQLRSMFVLIHSYHLVKFHAKKGNHQFTANLLLRVVDDLDIFPCHKYEILISTVIECIKAGLHVRITFFENRLHILILPLRFLIELPRFFFRVKKSAHKWASHIYKDKEFRDKLQGSIKKKIETCLRRPIADEEFPNLTRSPFSGLLMPEMNLTCPTTNERIPMCILTGGHMVLDDWCFCPHSGMPVLFSEYIKYIKAEESYKLDEYLGEECKIYAIDPILSQEVKLTQLTKVCAPHTHTHTQKKQKVSNLSSKCFNHRLLINLIPGFG